MAESTRPKVAVLSRTWGAPNDDRAFVLRELAGALSRHAEVDILVPGDQTRRVSDGLYDLYPVGKGVDGLHWPAENDVAWPFEEERSQRLLLTDISDKAAIGLAQRCAPDSPLALVTGPDSRSPGGYPAHHQWLVSRPAQGATIRSSDHLVGLSVPVNPLAGVQRHNGLGFVDYLLMLTDHEGAVGAAQPPAAVAWATARFPKENIVLVESARASVWRGRAHRGTISVDTRTDLWRLMAHAKATIDLKPGHLIGRECIESLRFGTPTISPAQSVGRALAESGAGLVYRNTAEMLAGIEVVDDPERRMALSRVGQSVADRDYGDPTSFVERVGAALAATLSTP